MLPNHNPFVIAEQFGTLDALFPGRIDLGLGRAPGADGRSSRGRCARTSMPAPSSSRRTWSNCARCSPAIPRCRSTRPPGAARRSRCGCSARACSARSSPRCSGCPMPSPPLRARPARCRAGALSRAVPAVGKARPAARDGGDDRDRRRDRRRGRAARARARTRAFVALRTGAPGQAAAAGGGLSRRPAAAGAGHARRISARPARSARPRRCARRSAASSSAPAPTR